MTTVYSRDMTLTMVARVLDRCKGRLVTENNAWRRRSRAVDRQTGACKGVKAAISSEEELHVRLKLRLVSELSGSPKFSKRQPDCQKLSHSDCLLTIKQAAVRPPLQLGKESSEAGGIAR